jgi:hypothetical protein
MAENETPEPLIVHVAIGNSDNKLTQRQWFNFHHDTHRAIESAASEIHGAWVSPSTSPYQNAGWAFLVIDDGYRNRLRGWLSELAEQYEQDSIAWNESATELITPPLVDSPS